MPKEMELRDIRIGRRIRKAKAYKTNTPTVFEIVAIEYGKGYNKDVNPWRITISIKRFDTKKRTTVRTAPTQKVQLEKDRSNWLSV